LSVRARSAQARSRKRSAVHLASKTGTSLKILWREKLGYSILYKRLDCGSFHLPEAVSGDASVLIDARELALILQGVESATRKHRVKVLAKRAREKALRISESTTTESPA
jgi:hypothetical protein